MNMNNGTIFKGNRTIAPTTGKRYARNSTKARSMPATPTYKQSASSAMDSVRNKFSGLKGGGGMDPTMMMFAMQAKQDAAAAAAERKANAKQDKEDAAIARRDQFFG